MPIATSLWPWRQARPNESVMTIAGRPAGRRTRRAARGPRRRGRAGASRSRVRRRAFDASTPAFAQTNPWRVRQISTPGTGAHELRRLVEHDLDLARVLAVLVGEQRARAAGLDVREVDDRALRLRHDLVRDDERRRRARRPPARSAAARDQRREVVARPRPRGARASAASLQASSAGRARLSARACSGGAPRRVGERGAQRVEVVGRVDVEHQRRRSRRRARSRRPPARAARGGRGCRCRSSARSRRAASAAARSCPVPWRSGTITTSGPSESSAAARRPPPASSGGRVAGDAAARGGALADAPTSMPRGGRLVVAVAAASRRPPARRSCAASTSAWARR